jgi:hypothetical protein
MKILLATDGSDTARLLSIRSRNARGPKAVK